MMYEVAGEAFPLERVGEVTLAASTDTLDTTGVDRDGFSMAGRCVVWTGMLVERKGSGG